MEEEVLTRSQDGWLLVPAHALRVCDMGHTSQPPGGLRGLLHERRGSEQIPTGLASSDSILP